MLVFRPGALCSEKHRRSQALESTNDTGCCSGFSLPVCSPALTFTPKPQGVKGGFYLVTKSCLLKERKSLLACSVLKMS